jgi:1-acyl-sn-glycerol-3-phosphate acyltransferase
MVASSLNFLRKLRLPMPALKQRVAESLLALLPPQERARVERYLVVDAGHGTDRFGMDQRGLGAAYALSWWLHEHWFTVRSRGHEHVPSTGAGVVVSNHSGVLPYDGVMIACDVFRRSQPTRLVRYMVDFFVYRMPFMGSLFRSFGQIPGTRANFDGLIRSGHLVGVFPEGAAALAKARQEHYQLRPFSHGHVELAARHGVPVVPCGVVGAEEQMRILADIKPLAKALRLPYFPLTTTLVIPKPVRYHLVYGPPMEIDADVLKSVKVREREVARVREAVEGLLHDGLRWRNEEGHRQ